MKPIDSSSNFHSASLAVPPSSSDRLREIVLLEEKDLYKYHPDQRLRAGTTGSQNTHPARTSGLTSSSRQASEHGTTGEQVMRSVRQYQLHVTPSIGPKPSITSVDTVPLNHGAIRPGGPVDLFSRNHIGLLLNWVIVGFFNGTFPAIANPLLYAYLGYNDYQLNAASALMTVPWGCKFLVAFLVDCVPINRQRRKPYIIIGWSVFTIFMIAMTIMRQPDPNPRDNAPGPGDNEKYASDGFRYVISIMLGSFAHVLSTVSVEGLMVEYAQREGEFLRGKTQSLCMIFRFMGEVTGTLSAALALNSKEYGGDFAHAVHLRVIFGAHAVIALIGIGITRVFLTEERSSIGSQRFASQLRRIWSILQQRTTWQITVFGFLQKLATTYKVHEYRRIYKVWLGAETLTLNVTDAVAGIGFIIAAALYMNFMLNTNWRSLLVWSTMLCLLVMIPADMVTLYDILRSQAFYLSASQITGVFDALMYVLRVVMIIEVAEPGYEAVTYGVITTVYNLGGTVVSLTKNLVATTFSKEETNLEADSSIVRDHLLHEYLFKYLMRILFMLIVLPLLPRQKRHLKEIKLMGNPTIIIPVLLFLFFAAVFIVSVVSNTLALFKSTSCLVFAGGPGCK